ncbi:AIPR family protein [Candidatus Venteria ishoeyi]|uniref:AIPR protein n=1 Tax=Candidatus Venteria ishoeyi TaxID=1899563 RepID=A0A1H6FHT7_9GAMM|nr:AIPR family protein [Candidatus Venteria ishoeyi]SEH08615.1 AIPR protein [Candidatus Venteria ishoeyi]
MDRITKQLVADLVKTQELKSNKESEQFEEFCNYTVLSNEYGKTFDLTNVSVGSGQDTGIDGIAIIVNGHLIEEVDEIDDLLANNGYLDATYLFIQAKTSSCFKTQEMHSFYFGINDFFSEESTLPRNREISKAIEISEQILNNASEFKGNPKVKSFFITTGIYNEEDKNVSSVRDKFKSDLKLLNIFDSIDVNILGSNEIGKLYRKTKNPISTTFNFSNKVTLQDIDGINQSYYGVLPFNEFKKILIGDNDNINNIFDDNVRDFQGINNPVNKSIAKTIEGENPDLFSVLNNGVAIVANTIKTSGNTFTIFDYQIVNGCQTSNVLYDHRHDQDIDKINIPLRLIVTDDEDVKSKITVSTNNQTAIKKEQLSAMSNFQKNLEHYYLSIEGEGKLYYERRSKQYNSDRSVIKRRIITVPIQIKSFSSIFSKNPHHVTSYFGNIVKKIGESGSSIFKSDHQYASYYMSGLCFYRLDSFFNSGMIDSKYRKVKFFILMLFPLLASEEELPPLNSQKKVEKYCIPIIDKLNNQDDAIKLFQDAIDIIDCSGIDIEDKQLIKSKSMTEKILASYNNKLKT